MRWLLEHREFLLTLQPVLSWIRRSVVVDEMKCVDESRFIRMIVRGSVNYLAVNENNCAFLHFCNLPLLRRIGSFVFACEHQLDVFVVRPLLIRR